MIIHRTNAFLHLGRLALVLALIALGGLDRAAVQGYAWMTMISDRTSEMGFEEALNDTFSGEHPCEICEAMAAADQKEQEENPLRQSEKESSKLFSPASITKQPAVFPPSQYRFLSLTAAARFQSVIHELPTPPPKVA